METGVIFYEMDPPYIYEDIVQHRFYVVGAEIRTRMYILHDHPFSHPIDTPQFNPDMPMSSRCSGSTWMLHFTRFMMGWCLTSIPISLQIRRTLSLSPWRNIFQSLYRRRISQWSRSQYLYPSYLLRSRSPPLLVD
ncbi:hypothetical protein AHAS_Ahas14G0120000 [Arachis hypogaea]